MLRLNVCFFDINKRQPCQANNALQQIRQKKILCKQNYFIKTTTLTLYPKIN